MFDYIEQRKQFRNASSDNDHIKTEFKLLTKIGFAKKSNEHYKAILGLNNSNFSFL